MIADLKPYAEYKESGLPWLGQVPRHWSVRRIKTVLRETDCRSADGTGTLLSLTRIRGLIPHGDMTDKMHSARTLEGYKRYRAGQLVMNRLQAWSGMFGAGSIDGLVSPDYAVFDVLGGHAIKLVLQRLKTPDMVAQFALESKGIGSGFNRLYTDRFGPIPISLPPPAEQAAIVSFLDWANGRLERAIRAKRKVIALLNEQKQAIIHHAVTRGLDPFVPLKPSGIPWLGDIPQHWEVRKIKSLARTVGGMTPNKAVERYWDGTTPWVSPKDMKVPEIFDSQDHISDAALRETNICLLSGPAVLIVVRGMILARMFPTAVTRVPVTINQDMKALVPRPELSVEFFALLLTGIQLELLELVEIAGHGTCCLRTDSWAAFCLPIPPLGEQAAIRSFLSTELATSNAAISRLQREIDLLREYRTRLVADVVTGKLDVREAATGLPDEAAPDTSAELAGDMLDDASNLDEVEAEEI